MSTTSSSFYVTGGTLRRDALSYVERSADTELYDGLIRGDYCYVLTSRQMGKSSLMVRTAVRLRADKVAVAVLDLTAIGQNVTPEQWYEGLLGLIGQQLDLEDELEQFWSDNKNVGPLQRWMRTIKEVVMVRKPGRIVIFVDEIDAVRSLPFSTDEFFAGLREFYNHRTVDAQLERLTFCLLGVATPSDLVRDTRTTPFNIGRRIELTDFTESEAAPLARGFERDEQTGQELLRRVLYWTGGHPYLTQKLCEAIAKETSVDSAGGVDEVCEGLFLSARARERDDNLLFVRERLLRSEEVDRVSLLELYLKVHKRKRVAEDETNPLVSILRLSGVTRAIEGYLSVRNRIYLRVFDRTWVLANMPDAELQRQNAAYRKGLVRAACVAAIIILIVTGLAVAAIKQRNRATRTAQMLGQTQEQLRAALVETQKQRDLARAKSHEAEEQKLEADEKRKEAEEQRILAQEKSKQAEVQKNIAEQQRHVADAKGRIADEQRKVAVVERENNRRAYYDASMSQVNQAWEKANLPRVQEALNSQKPNGDPDQEDLRGFEWFYRSRLANSFRMTLSDHEDTVFAVSFSPDGKRLASASGDKTIKLWDTTKATWNNVLSIAENGGIVSSIAFSPDGKRLVGGNSDSTVQVWEASHGDNVLKLEGHKGAVLSVAYSPDGKQIASASRDRTVKVWDAASGKSLLTLDGHRDLVCSVAFSPDGRQIASASYDRTVRLWDPTSGKSVLTLSGHRDTVCSIAFSPDGKRIASASRDKTVKVWDAVSGQEVLTLNGHQSAVLSVAFSPNGRQIASSSWDKTIRVWDALNGDEVRILKGHEGPIRSVAFSPDGKYLASASHDETIKVWNTPLESEMRTFKGHQDTIYSLAFSPDGKRIASASWDGTARVWDTASGKEVLNFTKHKEAVEEIAFSPDGKLIASSSRDKTVKIWDALNGQEMLTLEGNADPPSSFAFSPDGKQIAITGKTIAEDDYGPVRVYDVTSGKNVLTLTKDKDILFNRVMFSPDGKRIVGIATENAPGTVHEWDAVTGKELPQPDIKFKDARSLAFSPDGKWIAGGHSEQMAKVWDATTWEEVRTLQGHEHIVVSVAFSPDSKRLATASFDGTVKIWDTASGQEVLTLDGNVVIFAVVFSPDGKRLATADEDGTIRVWDAEQNAPLTTALNYLDCCEHVFSFTSQQPLSALLVDPDFVPNGPIELVASEGQRNCDRHVFLHIDHACL